MTTSPFSFFSKPVPAKKSEGKYLLKKIALYGGIISCSLVVGFFLGKVYEQRTFFSSVRVTVSKVPEINTLIERVSRHIVVDQNENPTVATVEDAGTLRAQNALFYRDALSGDKLLVWNNRAILYSPSRDKVLAAMVVQDVGTLQEKQPVSSAPIVQEVPKNITFELRNGSGVTGATKKLREELIQAGYVVSGVQNASGVYNGTIIVPMTNTGISVDQSALSSLVHGTYEPLPPSEAKSTADVLVIIGK